MNSSSRRFGTFEGVFTPSILTILGVIMYLRLGWVVGNAGFGGALLIILLAKVVTITTGLAMSSMTTNIRIGAGGFYSIISRSLGLEMGASIGIPLYLSQSLAVALYVVGFTEAWLSIFPGHDVRLVSSTVLVGLLILSYIGAKLAMKVQYIIMAVIVISLVSFFLGRGESTTQMVVWGDFSTAPFWTVFAIFFPAVTGIGAGAAMSGNLRDPHRSLPIGILSAIGVGLLVYIAVAFWFDRLASSELLMTNYKAMMDLARWRWAVLAGVFGATLSSALGCLVGGPRILMALGQHRAVPLARFLAHQSKKGEPRNAILFTGVLVEVSLLLGDLNSIAPLLTMFFLITYGMINLAVFIEKIIGITSFRPSFRVPLVVPLVGSGWCLITMFLINPIFAGVAIVIIILIYMFQVKKGLTAPWGDVRGGLFNAIAEWAAKMAARMPQYAKSWKPNLVVPVEDPRVWGHLMRFIRDIVFPKGNLRVFTVRVLESGVHQKISRLVKRLSSKEVEEQTKVGEETPLELEQYLEELVSPIRKEGIFTAATVIESDDFLKGINVVAQVLKRMFFPPNVIFLTMSEDPDKDSRLEKLVAISVREKLGTIILWLHPKSAFGREEIINLWLREGSPNRNLAILTALQLEKNWNGTIRLIRVIDSEEDRQRAVFGLQRIVERARMPAHTELSVHLGDFREVLTKAPLADLNIFGMGEALDCGYLREIAQLIQSSCLFVRDSGAESALA
ncbi:Na-K-Cl cotransporter [candidate division KSB1 bacterium]|nr:Na-K-Cl cotransporter [candidate division KSB1 bacterium]